MISRQSLPCFVGIDNAQKPLSLVLVTQENYNVWFFEQTEFTQNWINSIAFKAEKNNFCFIPNAQGQAQKVIACVDPKEGIWQIAHLPLRLPEGGYSLEESNIAQWPMLALGWGLGSYQFTAFKASPRKPAQLTIPQTIDITNVQSQLQAWYLVRDLINMPTESMGPEQLATAAFAIAQYYDMQFNELVGDELLQKNYPGIHIVGRASNREPRLIDMQWGDANATKITLIGKGVCFDSGGLNLKPISSIALMKKDMGGAAYVLGLAAMIMDAKLPIRLRVLIPAVENSISGSAYKPGDVVVTRKGLTVEIGNTDAEGRVVLADAITEAVAEKPDLIIDFATLTGAARIALGPDIPVLFSNDDTIAEKLLHHGVEQQQLLWRLPLYKPYREYFDSPIADMNNSTVQPYAGAITAALFLQEFVEDIPWVHFDIMAYNIIDKPGRPKGGEAMGLLAVMEFLREFSQ